MSLAPEYYFLDNSANGSDPKAIAGDDKKDGSDDNNAKQSYKHLLELVNAAEAGTVFYLGYSCGFTQTANFRITNSKAVTTIVSLTFDGVHCVCEMLRPTNITRGQDTYIKGAAQDGFNGLVRCVEVVNDTTFKYIPNGDDLLSKATRASGVDKMRCDAGTIKIEPYTSSRFVPEKIFNPVCEYSDSTQSQHRFDRGTIQGLSFSKISYHYVGAKTGKPNCFFIYQTDKESIRLHELEINGYRIGVYPNSQIGAILDLEVINCRIINNWGWGTLSGADFSLFEGNLFKNNGNNITGGSNKLHNMYLSNCHHTVVRDNELTESAMNNGQAMGTELVVHGVCSSLVIEKNWIHNKVGSSHGGNYGIGVNTGYNTPEKFTGIEIRENVIENCGRESISCNAWIGGVIEENEIVSSQPDYPHVGIMFDKERNTAGTPTTDGVSILNNIISGSSIKKDIDIQAGTNFTIVRPSDPPVEPPTEPIMCNVEVVTTTQVRVNGVVTAVNETITKG